MYRRIAEHPPVLDIYSKQLIAEGSISQDEYAVMKKRVWNILEEKYELSKSYKGSTKEWLSSNWNGFKSPSILAHTPVPAQDTGISEEMLRFIGTVSSSYPEGFTVHNNLIKILKTREKSVAEGQGIDWATAEALAFGSLVAENNHVRLSGQDVERGTFSHRHAVLHDQKNVRYCPSFQFSKTY